MLLMAKCVKMMQIYQKAAHSMANMPLYLAYTSVNSNSQCVTSHEPYRTSVVLKCQRIRRLLAASYAENYLHVKLG